jgi:hypothetical protein
MNRPPLRRRLRCRVAARSQFTNIGLGSSARLTTRATSPQASITITLTLTSPLAASVGVVPPHSTPRLAHMMTLIAARHSRSLQSDFQPAALSAAICLSFADCFGCPEIAPAHRRSTSAAISASASHGVAPSTRQTPRAVASDIKKAALHVSSGRTQAKTAAR